MQWLYYLVIIAFILSKTMPRQKKQKKNSAPRKYEPAPVPPRSIPGYQSSYAGLYTRVPLLTQREHLQYTFLKEIADKKNVLICPKVRLLDLVAPVPGTKNYKALMSKVMSKHVDFVICSRDMYVLGIIELDDSTHLRRDRMERDEFVDTVLKGAGYKIKHTFEITSDILDDFIGLRPISNPSGKIISPTGWIWNEETKLWDPPRGVR